MEDIKLDNQYRVIFDDSPYGDDFSATLREIVDAEESGKISKTQSQLLISLLFGKHVRNEIQQTVAQFYRADTSSTTVFLNSKTTNYA